MLKSQLVWQVGVEACVYGRLCVGDIVKAAERYCLKFA
jgi:hypothetical protein